MDSEPTKETTAGIEIAVRVQPKASRTEIVGLHDGRIKVAVTAAPEDGKANRAVRKLIAATLGVSASRVELLRGATSRNKDLLVTGISKDEVTGKLLP
jgi:uncharacterized protein (TIGR00251 family)